MANINRFDPEKILKDQRVIDEINRHLWIESEKNGCDIGFEQAKTDWLKKFANAWVEYHMPEAIIKERKSESSTKDHESYAQASEQVSVSKKRRAKSYI